MKTLTFSLAPATVSAALAVLASELELAGRLGGGDEAGEACGEDSGVKHSSAEK